MRITLVIPPKGFELDEKVFPSLGLLRVASSYEAAGHEVNVLDLSGVKDIDSAVAGSLGSDVYGITATMPQMPPAFRIVRDLRRLSDSRIILGGPHPTLLQASVRNEKGSGRATRAMRELLDTFDCVVAGDGEKAGLLALEKGSPKLIDADSPSSSLFLTGKDLDEAPLPARHLIDILGYHYSISGTPTMSMIAQLGCPFGCTFCGGRRSPFLRKVRTRSSVQVLAEMEHLYRTYGTLGFMFLDDELNVNRQFIELLHGMSDLQSRLGVTFKLRGLLKAELLTEPMAAAMYAAGFRSILIGFESGDERILKNIQKHCSVDDNTRAMEIGARHGMRVKALMSLGHAGESPDSIENTRRWLERVQPADFDVTVITVYPATPYYDDAVEIEPGTWVYSSPVTGDRLYQKEIDQKIDVPFYKGIPHNYESFVWTDRLSCAELVSSRDALESSLRALLKIPYPSTAAELNYEHSMGMS